MSKLSKKQKQIISKYKKAYKSLKRHPTLGEIKDFGLTERTIRTHFYNKTKLIKACGLEKSKKEIKEKQKNSLIEKYIALSKKLKRLPENSELEKGGLTRNAIREHFKNQTELHTYMLDKHDKELPSIFNEASFTEERLKHTVKEISSAKKFLITTAVVDKQIDSGFYNSLKTFCKYNKAELLILPCKDVASRKSTFDWNLDPALSEDHIIFSDLYLNSNLMLSSLKMSAKQIKPLTGLKRIAQGKASVIFASPKQSLELVANGNGNKTPRLMASTGAVTKGDYSSDLYMSHRTSYLAEQDHKLGAIFIEIVDGKTFYPRNIQCVSKDGSFCDLGKKYSPTGKVTKAKTDIITLGDWHSGQTDPIIKKATEKLCKALNPDKLAAHDISDHYSINHHTWNKIGERSKKYLKGMDSLKKEHLLVAEELKFLSKLTKEVLVVKSNHDDWLEQYLKDGKYVGDPVNHHYSLKLALALLEEQDPLKYAIENECGFKTDKVKWLARDESYKINGIEQAAHGDKGLNGSRWVSPDSAETAYGACNIAHSHTPIIYRDVFRAGTSTYLRQGYNSGPSSWAHAHIVQYEDSSRQLIIFVNGKYC